MIRPFESQEIFDEANDEIEDPLLANENTHHSGERKKKNLRFVREITERGGKRERRKGREREKWRGGGGEEEQSGRGNGVRVRKREKAMGTKREKGRLIDARSLIFATCTK